MEGGADCAKGSVLCATFPWQKKQWGEIAGPTREQKVLSFLVECPSESESNIAQVFLGVLNINFTLPKSDQQ